jgi:hypothetical protein
LFREFARVLFRSRETVEEFGGAAGERLAFGEAARSGVGVEDDGEGFEAGDLSGAAEDVG